VVFAGHAPSGSRFLVCLAQRCNRHALSCLRHSLWDEAGCRHLPDCEPAGFALLVGRALRFAP
jgi:hypothetical protein